MSGGAVCAAERTFEVDGQWDMKLEAKFVKGTQLQGGTKDCIVGRAEGPVTCIESSRWRSGTS
jgi:hypothetical protein